MSFPAPRALTSWRPYWAKRFGVAPFLPMSREEMQTLGWDSCDIILVSGDAYIDHPSFGAALIGRLLEAQGFRVGIIAQPDWKSTSDFRRLGRPNLFFGVSAGNMDSLVNHYTSERKPRSDDAYTAHGVAGRRPDRAVIVYAQRLREAWREAPIVIGGIEASLRRIAHFDYWSDKMRRSLLVDSKADLLLFGNAERAVVELAHRLARKEDIAAIRDLRGSAFMVAAGATPPPVAAVDPRRAAPVRLPSWDEVRDDRLAQAQAARLFHYESNPGNARAIVQAHGDRDVWLTPPPLPLSEAEMDFVYDLPYARAPHPSYGEAKIPAWEMIRFSIAIMRGCFGGCTFCSITEHEGRIIQSRSQASILREIETIRDKTPGFTGVISDLGGPTANMYRMACRDARAATACRRLSCVYPDICPRLDVNHQPLIELYRAARTLPGVKKVLIGSGLRYDLAVRSPAYIRELATHHVGGYLKIAPEHTQPGPLALMMKPGIAAYDKFKQLFDNASRAAGKEQYLIPYFIAAHPGSSDEDMVELALWLKRNKFRPDQVQTFLPTPLAIATTMWSSGYNPLKRLSPQPQQVVTARSARQRRLHKALLRSHDAANWPLLREALRAMGRSDLIGRGKHCLAPPPQPGASRWPSPARPAPGGKATPKAPGRKATPKAPGRKAAPKAPGRKTAPKAPGRKTAPKALGGITAPKAPGAKLKRSR